MSGVWINTHFSEHGAKQIRVPRVSLGFFPTPLAELERISRHLGGPRVFIKRDDQTGLATGGNKTRKLEFLIGDAIHKGCNTVVTAGAKQSNHCRQTAAAAAKFGLECHLLFDRGKPIGINGNLLLDMLYGAEIHWCGRYERNIKLAELGAKLSAQGKRPYIIPVGGSNAVGALGYMEAMRELKHQTANTGLDISHIIIATSSGGTQAGLTVGKFVYKERAEIIGIEVDKGETEASLRQGVVDCANSLARRISLGQTFSPSDFSFANEYLGGGYGVVGDLEKEAIRLLAQKEGILIGPVYTARAFGALIDMIKNGRFSKKDTVLFWHTGGIPEIFAYNLLLL